MALTNAQKLVEAQEALHQLNTGQMVRVWVDQNGERVEYTAASAARLEAYIAKLQDLIAGSVTRGPIGFFF